MLQSIFGGSDLCLGVRYLYSNVTQQDTIADMTICTHLLVDYFITLKSRIV